MTRLSSDPLSRLVTSFFRERLERMRGASRHTTRAYGHGLRLYFTFLANRRNCVVSALRLSDLDADGVIAFLDHLEHGRRNSVASRNCRLATLRSFFQHLLCNDPANADQYHRVLALSSKRSRIRPVTYLEPELVRTILAQPDPKTPPGLRDRALLLFLYNTGARISEALGIRMEDLEMARPPTIRIRGKGGRERFCPLWPETVVALRELVGIGSIAPGSPIFQNARGAQLTRDGAAYLLKKHVEKAAAAEPALRRRRITPHVLRHSCAVALLQAGVDLTVIRDYLGHASIATTSHYVSTNLETRRRALDSFWKRSGLRPVRTAPWKPKPEILRFLTSL